MINEIKGDLLEAYGIIVHGCDAKGVMGSGVALQIKHKWPKAYEQYVQQCKVPSSLALEPWRYWPGLSIVAVNASQLVCNMVTQEDYGRDGRKYVKYDWVDQGFRMLAERMHEYYPVVGDILRVVSFPLLGCGLGGGHWPVVREIIEHRLPDDRFIKNLYVL